MLFSSGSVLVYRHGFGASLLLKEENCTRSGAPRTLVLSLIECEPFSKALHCGRIQEMVFICGSEYRTRDRSGRQPRLGTLSGRRAARIERRHARP